MTGGPTDRPTVLALRALGLGDLLTAVPALRGIRRAFPHHRMVLATSPHLAPLVAEMEFIDETLAVGELEGLPVQLEEEDVAVNLHGRGPESTLLLLDATPSRLIAFAHPDVPSTFGFPRWRRAEHEVARWCRLLDESGIPAHPAQISLRVPSTKVGDVEGATVLHPGASSPARQWPPDRWAVVAWSLATEGEKVLITGSAHEIPLARAIAGEARLSPESVLAGQTDVSQLAAIVASAGRLVSSDTGPAHLATAFGTPSLTLFGPTSPGMWGPPPGRRHLVIWKGRSGRPNAHAAHPGLLDIETDEVLERLEHLPRRSVRFRRPGEQRPEDRTPVPAAAPVDRRPPGARQTGAS